MRKSGETTLWRDKRRRYDGKRDRWFRYHETTTKRVKAFAVTILPMKFNSQRLKAGYHEKPDALSPSLFILRERDLFPTHVFQVSSYPSIDAM